MTDTHGQHDQGDVPASMLQQGDFDTEPETGDGIRMILIGEDELDELDAERAQLRAQLAEAEARTWAAAVTALRDDQRYLAWREAHESDETKLVAGRHGLANYLEAVGPQTASGATDEPGVDDTSGGAETGRSGGLNADGSVTVEYLWYATDSPAEDQP